MSIFAQRSFAAGEIAPSLYARVDTVKYATGARTVRNNFVMRHGGVANRPGTTWVSEIKDSSAVTRLIPFVFNTDQTYVLEFGDQYIRFYRNGGQVLETATNITGITKANPAVVTSAAHGYENGDEVYISGVGGMTEVNGRNFRVANKTANTYELTYLDGTNVNSTNYTTYTSGGTAERVYEIATDYITADLFELQFVQSADVITITHPDYPPQELARTDHTAWTISDILFEPSINPPTAGITNDGTLQTKYTISAWTNASPSVITTSAAHGYTTGDEVNIYGGKYYKRTSGGSARGGAAVQSEIPSGKFKVTVLTATTFSIKVLSSGKNYQRPGGASDYVASSGTVVRLKQAAGTENWVTEWVITSVKEETFEESFPSGKTGCTEVPSSGTPRNVSWTEVDGAVGYNVYKKSNGVFGFIGYTERPTFKDNGITPDITDTPPNQQNPFKDVDDYPSCVSYFQQRRVFANTTNDPEKIWASRSGTFNNFMTSSPIQDDDAVVFTLAGREVNAIRHLIELGGLVVLSSGGEWTIDGDSAGILRPTDINPRQHSYNGASTVAPLIVGGSILYIQARGSIVRDLAFDFQADGFTGNDLTIFSAHLFDGYSISQWAYGKTPHSIVWAVRNDGILLGLTYVKEHQMVGWHHHDFDGTVESVCVVPEGSEDALYLIIKRTIDGATKRYVERLNSRYVSDIVDSIFVDCALSYDGRNTGATTMTVSGGTDWTYEEDLTMTASVSHFAATDVGNAIHITGADGDVVRFTITAYTSATVVTVRSHKTVPAAMRNSATTSWADAIDTVTNLWHIEGKAVSVFADGFVVANPNNDAYATITVTDGQITLPRPYAVIHVGLPYISDLETLDVDTSSGETMVNKKKLIGDVTVYVEKSRGLFAGASAPSDDTVDPLEGLYELKVRESEGYDDPVDLKTGTVNVKIRPEWNSNGRVFLRQVDPLPLSILAVAPNGYVPTGG